MRRVRSVRVSLGDTEPLGATGQTQARLRRMVGQGKFGGRHGDASRNGHDKPEISARQVRHRRRRRDQVHARLGDDDAGARHLGGAQCHRGCRPESVRHRRHAVLPGRRFDFLDLRRRRPRAAAQFLHGRVRRRLLDRGAGRHGDGPDGSRHVQGRGDLPRHERLFPGAHRRHRRALRGAGGGRRPAWPHLWLAERRPDVRADLHAPHARLRYQARAGRGGEGDP